MRFREVLQQLGGMLGGGGMANPMTATPAVDVREQKQPAPSGAEGIAQGHQGIAQGHIGSLFASLLGPAEGMQRAATGGMEGKIPGLSDGQSESLSTGIAASSDLAQPPTNQNANPNPMAQTGQRGLAVRNR